MNQVNKTRHTDDLSRSATKRLPERSEQMSALYMDSSCVASQLFIRVGRVGIFGFLMETLSPNPQCMRTPVPNRAIDLEDRKTEQVLLVLISLSDNGLSC